MGRRDLKRAVQKVFDPKTNLIPGVKASSSATMTVESRGIKQTAFAFAAAGDEIVGKANNEVLNFQRALVRNGRNIFEASIERDDISDTLGTGYGYNRRQTGNFTFGTPGTFVSRNIKINKDSGEFVIGWPDVARADALTDGVWRVLESGLPAALHKMPRFARPGAEPYLPLEGPAIAGGYANEDGVKPRAGITAKEFIQGAWEKTLAERRDKITTIPGEVLKKIK